MYGSLLRRLASAATVLALAALGGVVSAAVDRPFPSSRPADRLQALAVLGGGVHAPDQCLTLRVLSVGSDVESAGTTARRALVSLRAEGTLPAERRVVDRSGEVIRFTLDPASLDRLPVPETADGVPASVTAVSQALDEARALLLSGLDLPPPRPFEVVLAHLGPGPGGLYVPSGAGERAGTMWIDGTPGTSPGRVRSAVLHQYAHAVADRLGLAPEWAEALAGWVVLRSGAADAPAVERAISARFGRLEEGVPTDDALLALGNAAWFAWLDDARGTNALRIAVQELATDARFGPAMERALRRVDGSGFSDALRDFHLWAVLVGSRDDGRHFPFASRLSDPTFAEEDAGLPSLSIQAAPPVAPGGAAHAVVRPTLATGGVTVRFEGEFGAVWECDLLLRSASGELRRLSVPLDDDGRGQVTVPAQAADEIVVLVRNLQNVPAPAHRYTWTAFRTPGYPVEFASLSATSAPMTPGAVSIRWETTSEIGLVGFHVLRAAAGGAEFRRVHPVWMPAVGTASEGALYEFVDFDAAPGVRYVYRVDAVTELGLIASSTAVPMVSNESSAP